MVVYKCDMCGEEIDTVYEKIDDYIEAPSMFRVNKGPKKGEVPLPSSDLKYILCQNCTNKLMEVIKNG